ncbi:hypothetical protein AB0J82_39330 [Asanoa sp. NPDC049518]|uniref:hypothetical protein n=1 Tax=unclassified Asanoa TaxID=2685164 RepID=UPI00341F82BB
MAAVARRRLRPHRSLPADELWRVTCDGVVRLQALAAWQSEHDDGVQGSKQATPDDTRTAQGTVDQATAGTALGAYRALTAHAGLSARAPAMRWGGSVPGVDGRAVPAVLVGPESGAGPAVLQVRDGSTFMVATGPEPRPRRYYKPDEPGGDYIATMSWAATAASASTELMAVRVPVRKDLGAHLTDTVVVLAPPGTVQVGALAAGRRVWKTDGAEVIEVRHRGDVTLRALDATGAVLATAPMHDPADGDTLFGERLVDEW